ncbi:MAG: exonuclease SbcCD subunit D C-terminal domain-containing protein [Planctomycetia bacterium]|nr:exonuclease SbcCD subunit D C-terminal domain-containing protein [Planctomycetia bacterium]
MRLLHTSDWHLGHALHDHPRTHEHARFLAWLLATIADEHVDALIVAGDVFDVANPSTEALDAFYDVLARARQAHPRLGIVVVGGNHDSPARLDVTNPLLDRLGVRVVGGLPRRAGGGLDVDRLVAPLHDARGTVAAWCVAMPFLRPADLPAVEGEGVDPLIEGVRRRYAEALDAARARRAPGQAIVATGHAYLTGTRLSELSERRILGGNQHALPVDVFPDDVAYVALGHLHLAQVVGGRETVRYSGSPLPLSFAERAYPHQVVLVDLEGERVAAVRPVRVPRAVDLLVVPDDGARPLAEVLALVRALPAREGPEDDPARPLLEVRVRCDHPEPHLRREVEAAAAGRRPRLLRIAVEAAGDGRALADAAPAPRLRDVTPRDVFVRKHAAEHGGEPSPALAAAFDELLEAVLRGEAPK